MPKLCECGCGNPAPISDYTNKRRGVFKGQPQRFIRFHAVHTFDAYRNARKIPAYLGPTKLCECGCGQPAPIATQTHRKNGVFAGHPRRFIQGHSNRKGYGTTHGYQPAEYKAYHNAKERCINPNRKRYSDYGGRGIQFRFESFEQFMAELGPRPAGVDERGKALYSLDRIDNDGHYAPGNVRWATLNEQRNNQRRSRKKKPCEVIPTHPKNGDIQIAA